MIPMKHGESFADIQIDSISDKNFYYLFRPSLFDDFVEYERERLRNSDNGEQDDDTNNNHLNIQ